MADAGPAFGPHGRPTEVLRAEREWLADIYFDDSSASTGIPAETSVTTP
jgi:hypothetical protein